VAREFLIPNGNVSGVRLKLATTEGQGQIEIKVQLETWGWTASEICFARCGEQLCYESFDRGIICGCGKILFPIYVREAHAGRLGGKLFAEFACFASWQSREGFEDDAVFGILPAVRAQVRKDGCTFRGKGGWIVYARRQVVAHCPENSGFEVEAKIEHGHR